MKLFDSFVNKFFNSEEKTIVEKFIEIVEIGIKTNEKIPRLFDSNASIDEIRKLERQSDRKAFEIYNIIISGAIAPNLIDILLEFVNIEDNIIDTLYNLAREILRYKVKNIEIQKYIKDSVLQGTVLIGKTLLLLHEMEKLDDLYAIKKIRAKIQKNEQLGDKLKDSIFDFAYEQKVDFKTFYHLLEIGHKLDDVLDSCEDSSDAFMTFMSSLVT
ncbi:MAG: DUF47 family protein [Candidatus Marsarchaeota archaeon]|nr:DUF47 family protein [Candidatus Marsarchaeota archaeon]MCL5094471.1 DUF47 family protein [Candidatus Marsarchaeota archaeon]